jgi:nucleoside 2-deoxyribosyltransferase
MKIYFSCSIRGARPDPETILRLIGHLKRHGTILTEHIGDVLEGDEVDISDEEIFLRDVAWLREADVLVAEVTAPSLGVGYEIGVAETLGKPVLCLYQRRLVERLSAMIAGNMGLTVRGYDSPEEAFEFIDEFLESNVC